MKGKKKLNALNWDRLLSPLRRKEKESGSSESMNTGQGRKEIERDFDRILFATPTRRLADKTQVFPLDKNDSVRTRLTHSYEVSNLARSIGVRVSFDFAERVFGPKHEELEVKRNIPSLLAAIALAHDLGNPPFGHQGEEAIKQWFKETNEKNFQGKCHADFLKFDGNAQTIRLLTRLQVLNDDFGLNLTYATLAALTKYPSFWDSGNKNGYKKWGVFQSERPIIESVWTETGLNEGQRHPLTYIMEACDDIAYSALDAEDTVKKGYASFNDLIDFLEHNADGDSITLRVIEKAKAKNQEFKSEQLSSYELNDISMQMFRVKAIFEMVNASTESFLDNIDRLMEGSLGNSFELIKASTAAHLCKTLKQFDKRHGFNHKDVLKLELQGSNYIKSVMDLLWHAIDKIENKEDPFASYAYNRISENYRRVFEKTDKDQYAKCQLLCDAVSGMTDSYLISLHDELRPLSEGFRRY